MRHARAALALLGLTATLSVAQTTRTVYTGPKVELTFVHGHTGPDLPTMAALVKRFNDAHDNISVKVQAIPWGTLVPQIAPQVAAGKAADISAANETDIPVLAARGALEEMTPSLLGQAGINRSSFYPRLWDTAVYKGKLYGLPDYSGAFVLYYNKDLMAKLGVATTPPTNRSEFLAAAQRCTTDKGGKRPGEAGFDAKNLATWGMGVPVPWIGGTIAYSVLVQNGGNIMNADGNPTLDTRPAANTLQFLIDLVQKYSVSPTNADETSEQTAFKQGKTCFNITGNWGLDTYRSTQGLNFGVAPFPRLGTVRDAAWGGSGHFVLPKQPASYDPNKRAAALEFLRFMTLPAQNLTWTTAGSLPSRPDVAASKDFQASPMAGVARGLRNVYAHASFPWVLTIRNAWDGAFEAALLGKKTVAQALKDAQSDAEKQVASARETFK